MNSFVGPIKISYEVLYKYFPYIIHTICDYLPLVAGIQPEGKEPLSPKAENIPKVSGLETQKNHCVILCQN